MRAPCLNTQERDDLVRSVRAALGRTVANGCVRLRGSLADGRADAYSDIDVRWEVPDRHFTAATGLAPEVLSAVRPVENLRLDPDFQNSALRRMLFVQFKGTPLFWRLDLEVVAHSIRHDPDYDRDNPHAKGHDWSVTHSALMNAIAAIKALLRHKPADAEQLLLRAYQRIGLEPGRRSPGDMIPPLVRHIAAIDPAVSSLAARVRDLHQEVFAE
jgi:hypothetical protein